MLSGAERQPREVSDPVSSLVECTTPTYTSNGHDPSNLISCLKGLGLEDADVKAVSQDKGLRRFLQLLVPWILPYSELKFTKEVRKGRYSSVYLGRWRGTKVAIRKLTPLQSNSGDYACDISRTWSKETPERRMEAITWLHQEVAIHSMLRHPNILIFLGVSLDPPCVLTERCENGNLADLLAKARSDPELAASLSWYCRLTMLLDVAKALLHLHTQWPAILHRDLRTACILVGKEYHCKVSGFQMALREGTECPSMLCSSTPDNSRFLAPEVTMGEKHTKASDVFAFGMIMYEVLTWTQPWGDLNPFQIVVAMTASDKRPELPKELEKLPGGTFRGAEAYINMMQQCWRREPDQRPGIADVINLLRRLITLRSCQVEGCTVAVPNSETSTTDLCSS
eukprot:jgi/Botrbrau1/14885/Bobra.0248s0004.1